MQAYNRRSCMTLAKDDHDCDHQKDMDESAHRAGRHQSQGPQDQPNNGNAAGSAPRTADRCASSSAYCSSTARMALSIRLVVGSLSFPGTGSSRGSFRWRCARRPGARRSSSAAILRPRTGRDCACGGSPGRNPVHPSRTIRSACRAAVARLLVGVNQKPISVAPGFNPASHDVMATATLHADYFGGHRITERPQDGLAVSGISRSHPCTLLDVLMRLETQGGHNGQGLWPLGLHGGSS